MHVFIKWQFSDVVCLAMVTSLVFAPSGCRRSGPDIDKQPIANQANIIRPDGQAAQADQFAEVSLQVRALVDEGRQQAEQQNWDGAIEKYTMALQYRWPKSVDKREIELQNAEMYLLRGRAFVAMQLSEIAIEDFSDAIRFGDYDLKSNAYVERANARSELEQWSQAAADCISAIRLQPKNGEAFLVKSRALANMGRLDLARISLQEAEQLGIHTTWKVPIPEPRPSAVIQAQSSLDSNRPLVAIEALEAAQLEGHDTWESNGLLARTYLQMNQPFRAMVASSIALRQNPQFADAYQTRGLARLQTKSYDWAIADLTAAVGLDASLAESLQPSFIEARRGGGIDPEIRAQAIIQIKKLAAENSEITWTQSEPEKWLMQLIEMPNSTDQIEHFKDLMIETPESSVDSLNWLSDFLMLDLKVPAVSPIRTWLNGKSPDMPPSAARLWERVTSRKAAASHGVNLYPDVAAYAIDYEFNAVLRACIDLGICNLTIDHMYRAVARTDSSSLRLILPHAMLSDRKVAGLLQYCVEHNKREDVVLIISRYERSLTFQILEFLGLAKALPLDSVKTIRGELPLGTVAIAKTANV